MEALSRITKKLMILRYFSTWQAYTKGRGVIRTACILKSAWRHNYCWYLTRKANNTQQLLVYVKDAKWVWLATAQSGKQAMLSSRQQYIYIYPIHRTCTELIHTHWLSTPLAPVNFLFNYSSDRVPPSHIGTCEHMIWGQWPLEYAVLIIINRILPCPSSMHELTPALWSPCDFSLVELSRVLVFKPHISSIENIISSAQG